MIINTRVYCMADCIFPYTISMCWCDSSDIGICLICRVGSESLILGTMWCRLCRHCYLELIGQSLFLTQLTDSWPLEEVSFSVWGSWETILEHTYSVLRTFSHLPICFLFLYKSPCIFLFNFQQLFCEHHSQQEKWKWKE